jgi:hypothetical protein
MEVDQETFFFNFLDLTVLNTCIFLQSRGSRITCQNFQLALVRNMIDSAGTGVCPWPFLRGRPASAENKVGRLDIAHNKHWPIKARTSLCLGVPQETLASKAHTNALSVMSVCVCIHALPVIT